MSGFTLHSNSLRPVGRFAPSPTGRMHIGNLFSYLVQYLVVKKEKGRVILRIEDLDTARSKQTYIDQCLRDFEFFGFSYEGEVLYQSKRTDEYLHAFEQLKKQDLVYPCFCSRASLNVLSAPHPGEEFVYPGICRNLSPENLCMLSQVKDPSYRVVVPDQYSEFIDLFQGPQRVFLPEQIGDFVVRRADKLFAYQLAVVVDDYESGINTVVRGSDLLLSTHKQNYLARVLGLVNNQAVGLSKNQEQGLVNGQENPQVGIVYGHVPLIVNEEGVRLSKRNMDASLEYLVDLLKWTPDQVLSYLASLAGMIPEGEVCSLDTLVEQADLSAITGVSRIIWKSPL
ncbi:MAG: glutamate--tRNA ligase family protein [Anaerotardibacter sp.]